MNTFKKITLIICLLVQGVIIAQTDNIQVFSDKYEDMMKEQDKGIALLIKKEGQISSVGIGNFDLTDQSVFNIGSATKTFTSILILQEVEKGTLKLDDAISNFLSPINNVDGTLTIETLLSHESGLDEVVGKNILDIFYSKNDSLYDLDLLTEVGPNDPDMVGKYDYCNTNFLLLGKILESVTDQIYFDLVRERIIEPLKMTNTYAYVHKNIPNLATPYHGGEDITEYLDYRYFANTANAAGCIASTLVDMEKFYVALFETEKLLSASSLNLMLTSGNEHYGLGIMKSELEGDKIYSHGGNNIGYAFRNSYNPKTKELYLLFSNDMSIPFGAMIEKDLDGYMNDVVVEVDLGAVDMTTFEKYVGSYMLKEANLKLDIVVEDSCLYLVSEAQGVKSKLMQKNDTTIYDTLVGVTLEIIKDNENELKFAQNGFETSITRITE